MKLIIALDYPDKKVALEAVDRFGEMVEWYKVGLQLFTAAGPSIIAELVTKNKKVFLDLKYHDIPQTVYGAVSAAADIGASIVDIHLSGGREMIQAAREAATLNPGLQVFGVSVLTSLDDDRLSELGIQDSTDQQVMRLIELANSEKLDGVVCSVNEVECIKAKNANLKTITPGIRLENYKLDDQVRVATPERAKSLGADFVVVGRPVTQSSEPLKTLEMILNEIS